MAEPSLISNAVWLSDDLIGRTEVLDLNLNTQPTSVESVIIDFKVSWDMLCMGMLDSDVTRS